VDLARESGDRSQEATVLNNIGWLYDGLKEYDQALEHYQEALPLLQEIQYRLGVARTQNNIGLILRDLGNFDQAQIAFQQALSLQQEIGDRSGEANTLGNLGVVLQNMGLASAARSNFEEALAIHQEIGDRDGEATALSNIGWAHESLEEYEQALERYRAALAIFVEIGNRPGQAAVLGNIGRVLEKMGDQEGALDAYLESLELTEALRAEIRVSAFKANLAGEDMDVYQAAVELLVHLERPQDAFALTERGRARAFLDTLGNKHPDLQDNQKSDLLQQEQQLRGEIAAVETALVKANTSPEGERSQEYVQSLASRLTGLQASYEDLLNQIELKNPELASLVAVSTVDLAQAQAALDDQTILLSYFMTEQSVYAYVLSRDALQVVELPATPDEIIAQVRAFRELGLANLGNPHPRSLTDLYAWLITPLESYLDRTLLGIVPHQELHYVPFAALSDGEQVLGERFALFYLPSVSSLPLIQAKGDRQLEAPLIFGDPALATEELPRLAFAAQEAEKVAELFETQAYQAEGATEALLRSASPSAGALHIAAHGGFNPEAPLFSRLWLAPGDGEDGKLNVFEVYALDLNKVDLVVLSACQTQMGALSAGDELIGLNRAFLFGSPTVIASLWSVDDEATGVLMERFYTHLLEGIGKAQALQAAQHDIRSDPGHPEWAHPYYWAAFVLNGDPGELDPGMAPGAAAPWGRIALFGGMGLGVIGVVVTIILLRRRSRKVASGATS